LLIAARLGKGGNALISTIGLLMHLHVDPMPRILPRRLFAASYPQDSQP
jgi:hypothetical protein